MSLTIFINEEEAKLSGFKEIMNMNDLFFDSSTSIGDNELVKDILSTVDKAGYDTKKTFVDRTGKVLHKSSLSTGTKTLLNILNYPDLCFDVAECGNNALKFLPRLAGGNILWRQPCLIYAGNPDCDIIYNGNHYNNIFDVLEVLMDRREQNGIMHK